VGAKFYLNKFTNPKGDEYMTNVLNIKDVAKILQISTSTVYKYAENGKIPSIKIGTARRFLEKDIERYVETCREPTLSSNSQPAVNNAA
jgi:PTS system nitrogen regulatory IIA component